MILLIGSLIAAGLYVTYLHYLRSVDRTVVGHLMYDLYEMGVDLDRLADEISEAVNYEDDVRDVALCIHSVALKGQAGHILDHILGGNKPEE